VNINSDVLVSAIQKVMTNFEERFGDSLSLQDIADKTNSSYTTIREIKKGILKNLSVKKALEISKRLDGPVSLNELLEKSQSSPNPDISDVTQKYSHLFEYALLPTQLDQLFGHKEFCKILWAAFSTKHILKSEILRRWGEEGQEKLNFLLEVGIVIDEGGLIKGVAEKAGGGPQTAIKELEVALAFYNILNSQKQENWVSFQTNSVNTQFIKKFREELRVLFRKFDELSNLPEFIGNEQMFFGMIFDRYVEDLLGKKDKLQ